MILHSAVHRNRKIIVLLIESDSQVAGKSKCSHLTDYKRFIRGGGNIRVDFYGFEPSIHNPQSLIKDFKELSNNLPTQFFIEPKLTPLRPKKTTDLVVRISADTGLNKQWN